MRSVGVGLCSILVIGFLGTAVGNAAKPKHWNWKLTSGMRGNGFAINQNFKNKKIVFTGEILFEGEVIETNPLTESNFEMANQLLFAWMKRTSSFDHTFSTCRSAIRLSFSDKGRASHKAFCPDLMSPSELKEFGLVQDEVKRVILAR